MEIHSLYSLDIFLQGLFLLFCLSFSFYIVFQDNLEKFRDIHSIHGFSDQLYETFQNILDALSFIKKSNDTSKLKSTYFGLIPIIIALSFIIGILGKGTADKWIDSTPKNHFYFKPSFDTTSKGAVKIKETVGFPINVGFPFLGHLKIR